MEKNVLNPKGAEIQQLFTKHFDNLMQTYRIENYLFISNSDDGKCLIRGSPERLSVLLIAALESDENLRKIIVKFLRDSKLIGGDHNE